MRPLVEDEDALSMQPVCRPVRGDIAAVAPNRADLHAAHCLPDVLPFADVATRNDYPTVRGDDLIGEGRCLLVDAGADPAEDRKRAHQDRSKSEPEIPQFPFPLKGSRPEQVPWFMMGCIHDVGLSPPFVDAAITLTLALPVLPSAA